MGRPWWWTRWRLEHERVIWPVLTEPDRVERHCLHSSWAAGHQDPDNNLPWPQITRFKAHSSPPEWSSIGGPLFFLWTELSCEVIVGSTVRPRIVGHRKFCRRTGSSSQQAESPLWLKDYWLFLCVNKVTQRKSSKLRPPLFLTVDNVDTVELMTYINIRLLWQGSLFLLRENPAIQSTKKWLLKLSFGICLFWSLHSSRGVPGKFKSALDHRATRTQTWTMVVLILEMPVVLFPELHVFSPLVQHCQMVST